MAKEELTRCKVKIDLYKIYNMYNQRCRRYPDSLDLLEIKQNMKYLLKNELSKPEMIEVAKRIQDMESELGYRKNYSLELVTAIAKNNYFIEIPYPKLHEWNETEATTGWLYLATGIAKAGEVKVGATTIPLWKREEIYLNRWGYSIDIRWSKWINKPFSAEGQLKKCLKVRLVSGLTSGDSNEWYYGDINEIAVEAERISRNFID